MKPSKLSTTAVCALHYAKLLIRLAIFITLQFARNHVKTGRTDIRIEDNNAVFLVALV